MLSTRSLLYSRPGPLEVNGHGGDVINRKLQQALKELGKSMQVDDHLVVFNEEMAKVKSGRGGGKTTPKKVGGSPVKEGSSSKKRKGGGKGVDEDEDEEEAFWMSKDKKD